MYNNLIFSVIFLALVFIPRYFHALRVERGSILFFDYRFCTDDPIMDDPHMHDFNVQKKVDAFFKAAREQAAQVCTYFCHLV